DRGRGARGRRRRRPGRGTRADRRPLAPGRAAQGRRDRLHRLGRAGDGLPAARRRARRARTAAPQGRARDPDLVGPGRRGRGARRRLRRADRLRREAGQRRLLPPADAERARARRGVGGRGRRGGGEPRADRAPLRLRRRRRPRPARPRARRAVGARDRYDDVPGDRGRLGRPRAPGDELPRARRDVHEPRGPPAAAAPGRRTACARRARLDLAPRRALRCRGLAVPVRRLRRALRADLRRPALWGGGGARGAPRPRAAREGRVAAALARGSCRRRPAARPLPATLLRRRRRAGARASLPAAGTRARALARRRRPARDRPRRGGRRPLERHLAAPAGADRRAARPRRRPRGRGALGRPAGNGGGGARVSEPWWITLIKAFVIVNLVMLAFAYTTLLERKLLGRMQLRYGPNRAGPYGLLQPFADLIQ